MKRTKAEVQRELENEYEIIRNWPNNEKKAKVSKLLKQKAMKIAYSHKGVIIAPKYVLE